MTSDQEQDAPDALQLDAYTFSLKIPKERIAVLIGKQGQGKTELEQQTKTKLNIDSEEGDVEIFSRDPIALFTAKEIIRAIGRGFNPLVALQLLKQDYIYEQIQLNDYFKSKNHFIRVRGRLIGKDGKSRETIELLTETHISVYGKTVAVIGRVEQVSMAKQAILSLIQGSPHANVYKWLERRSKEFREAELADQAVPETEEV